jgi:putative ABC transport system permease protein
MLALTLRGIGARKVRGVLTALAVFFGVAMIAGTLMLTDSVNNSFDDIFAASNSGIDVSIKTKETIEDSRGAPPPPFDEAVLERVLAVDGVAEASGYVFDPTISVLGADGERVGPAGPPHFAAAVLPDTFSPWNYTEGGPPEGADEMGIDNFTAEREGWTIGQRVRVAGTGGATEYEISGIAEWGSGVELLGAAIAILTLPEAQRLTDKVGQFDQIVIAAEEGVSPEELKADVQAAIGSLDGPSGSLEVLTGEETAAEESAAFKDGFSFFSNALIVFGVIALFVGGFIIFNTFSITVAQRTREFGMLRTLGAHRRQVLRAVLLEAAVVGLVASVIGILGGIGFVAGIVALFKSFGLGLPSSGLVLSARTVVIALLVGVVVTMIAALVPARRATRVTPMEALRESQVGGRPSRRRAILGGSLLGLAVLLIAWGMFATASFGAAFVFIGPGILLLFLGVALLSRRLVGPLSAFVGWPLERFGGVPGQLAHENTQRNKSRTATTAAALMIGLALVVFVATFASALNRSVDQALDDQFAGDLVLNNSDGGFLRIPTTTADAVRGIDGVAVVSPVAGSDALVEGVSGTHQVSGLDAATVARVATFDWREGSDATLAELGEDGAIIESDWGKDNGVAVGDVVRVTTPTGSDVSYTVRGSVRDEINLLVSSLAVAREGLLLQYGVEGDNVDLVGFEEGADFDIVRRRIDSALAAGFPNVESRSQAEVEADSREELNQILVLVYALLALSILIALFGVVNTLILTIHERTREIGMLRAIGTSKRQVKRMIRYESVITAMIGAIIGTGIGLILAIVSVQALSAEGLVLSIPYPLIVILLLLAAVAGIAAAIAPARRAAKTNIIEALLYE